MAESQLESVQDLLPAAWWEKDDGKHLIPGRLAWTFAPFPDVVAQGLRFRGRADPRDHTSAKFQIEPLKQGKLPTKHDGLPVAGVPLNPGETYVLQRGKRRPVLILSTGGPEIDKATASRSPGYIRKSCVLAAPYYGADQDGTRGGFPPPLVDRIRCMEYPQFMLESLPIPGPKQSILRFDHTFAAGMAPSNYELTEFRLRDEALELMHEWLRWLVEGVPPPGGLLELARESLMELGPP